jgi:hypothetical protein
VTNKKLTTTFNLNNQNWEKFLQLMESQQLVNDRLVKLLIEPSIFEKQV